MVSWPTEYLRGSAGCATEKTGAALLVPSGPLQAPLVSIAPPDSLPCRCPPGRLFMHVPMLIPATGLRLEGEAPLRDHHGATRCHHQSSRAGPRISQPLFSPSPPGAQRSVLAPSHPQGHAERVGAGPALLKLPVHARPPSRARGDPPPSGSARLATSARKSRFAGFGEARG